MAGMTLATWASSMGEDGALNGTYLAYIALAMGNYHEYQMTM